MYKTLEIEIESQIKSSHSKYYPLFFNPVYKEAIWGGDLLPTLGRNIPESEAPTAESWEIVDRPDSQSCVVNGKLEGKSLRELIKEDPQGIVGPGHRSEDPFPLLLKIIDAGEDLSLQVHPDETCCKYLEGAEAKTEMWYVLDHKEKAEIMAGIKENVTQEKFCSLIDKPEIRNCMKSSPSRQGSSFFIKATTVHAIGGGNLIYEIQQNSNTTYRVSDWGRVGSDGRPRQLHIEEAITCLEHKSSSNRPTREGIVGCHSGQNTFLIRNLANCDFFQVDEFTVNGIIDFKTDQNSFQTFYAVNNDLQIEFQDKEYLLRKGQTCLIPAKISEFRIKAQTESIFIRSQK